MRGTTVTAGKQGPGRGPVEEEYTVSRGIVETKWEASNKSGRRDWSATTVEKSKRRPAKRRLASGTTSFDAMLRTDDPRHPC